MSDVDADIWTDRDVWDRRGVELRCAVPNPYIERTHRVKAEDDTRIVGESLCSRLGDDWSNESRPPFVVWFAAAFAHTSRNTLFAENGERAAHRAYTVPAGEFGLGGFVLPILYLGAVARAGGIVAGKGGGPGAFYLSITPLVGARLPLGRFSLRTEILAGPGAFVVTERGENRRASFGWIEPRAAVDFWVTPHLTVSAAGGVPLTATGLVTGSLALTYHFRAFDGVFAP